MKNFNDKYTIKDFIDKNRWSNVYMAINNETNEEVILNILINVNENIESFEEAVNKLKTITSYNLIPIHNISSYINKEKKYYYIESEYFEGINLYELPEVMNIDEINSLEIIREVIKAVMTLHREKINYISLTEDKIFINNEGRVKISMLELINNYQGHIKIDKFKQRIFDDKEEIINIGNILCELIMGDRCIKEEVCETLDKKVVDILYKSSGKSNVTYNSLAEFLDDINSYVDFIDYQDNLKREAHKSKMKKYISIASSVVVLLGVGFSVNHFMNKSNDKDKNVPIKTEKVSNENYLNNKTNENNKELNKEEEPINNNPIVPKSVVTNNNPHKKINQKNIIPNNKSLNKKEPNKVNQNPGVINNNQPKKPNKNNPIKKYNDNLNNKPRNPQNTNQNQNIDNNQNPNYQKGENSANGVDKTPIKHDNNTEKNANDDE